MTQEQKDIILYGSAFEMMNACIDFSDGTVDRGKMLDAMYRYADMYHKNELNKKRPTSVTLEKHFTETLPAMNAEIVARHTEPKQERFRMIPARWEHNPIKDVDLSEWEVTHYLLGDRMAKSHITKEHFDSISVLGKSQCPKKLTWHLHAIGYRKLDKSTTVLILGLK